jgi:hypothetical protein
MKFDKDVVVSCIIKRVHEACEELGIKQGAIGVCIEPKKLYFGEWAGVPTLATHEIAIASVRRGSDDTLCYDENGNIVGDGAGVVCMKIAATKQMMHRYEEKLIPITSKEELTSGAVPKELSGNGLTQWKGCVAIPVGYLSGGGCGSRGEEAMIFYIAVSGGKQEQDEAAAWTALEVIRDTVATEDGFMLHRALVI